LGAGVTQRRQGNVVMTSSDTVDGRRVKATPHNDCVHNSINRMSTNTVSACHHHVNVNANINQKFLVRLK